MCGDYVGVRWVTLRLRCGFAVGENELNRGAGREPDSHNPALLLTLEDALLLAIDT